MKKIVFAIFLVLLSTLTFARYSSAELADDDIYVGAGSDTSMWVTFGSAVTLSLLERRGFFTSISQRLQPRIQ